MQSFGLEKIWNRIALLLPSVGFIVFFMILPLALMSYVSVLQRGEFGGVQWGTFTTDAYRQFLFEENLDGTFALNTDYIQIFARSFWLSSMTTIVAFLIGYPTALFMAMQPERRKNLMVFLVTIPFWTNLLVRNYAWILLLREHGPIGDTLVWLGIFDTPPTLLYNDFAIGIGLTYSFLPFMVLPIYSSLEKLDFRLVEAAYDLYADKMTALRRVVLPLSLPGVIAGSILVFVPSLGAYVTPVLLGGSKNQMIGNLIQAQFGAARNWPFGAALAFSLLAIVILALTLQAILRNRSAAKEG